MQHCLRLLGVLMGSSTRRTAYAKARALSQQQLAGAQAVMRQAAVKGVCHSIRKGAGVVTAAAAGSQAVMQQAAGIDDGKQHMQNRSEQSSFQGSGCIAGADCMRGAVSEGQNGSPNSVANGQSCYGQ
jgi:hypothetical protein